MAGCSRLWPDAAKTMPQLVIYWVTYLPDFASLSNPTSGSFIAIRIVMDALPCSTTVRSIRVHALGKDQRTSRRCGRFILRDKEPLHQQTIVIAVPPCLRDGGKRGSEVKVGGYGDNAPADRLVRKKI